MAPVRGVLKGLLLFGYQEEISIGSEATLTYDGCMYLGVREIQPEIEFFSTEDSCAESIALFEIVDDLAQLFINPRPAKALSSGTPVCVSAQMATVGRS